MAPNFYISKENYNELIGPGFYRRMDIPSEIWTHIKDHFGMNDTLALFASGDKPHKIDKQNSNHGGIDWLKLEPNRKKGEPPLNAYHYAIGKPSGGFYPVFGPYKDGALIPHWPKKKDIEKIDGDYNHLISLWKTKS